MLESSVNLILILDHQAFLKKNNPKIFLGEKALFGQAHQSSGYPLKNTNFLQVSQVKKVANLIKYTKFCVPASDKVFTQELSWTSDTYFRGLPQNFKVEAPAISSRN